MTRDDGSGKKAPKGKALFAATFDGDTFYRTSARDYSFAAATWFPAVAIDDDANGIHWHRDAGWDITFSSSRDLAQKAGRAAQSRGGGRTLIAPAILIDDRRGS